MTSGLAKMWLSFVAMGLMIIAALLILLTRAKLKGVFRFVLSIVSYFLFVVGGLLMFLVVASGPE